MVDRSKQDVVVGLDSYQNAARNTAVYPGQGTFMGLAYATLGLVGETGEVAEHVKKTWRDEGALTAERREKIKAELGDVLWYVARVASEAGLGLGGIAALNLDKLADRQKRDVLHGSGDER